MACPAATAIGGRADQTVIDGLVQEVDLRTRTATLIASDDQPEGLSASPQGDAQPLPGGGRLVGWGAQPYVAQFDAAGRLVFDAELPAGTISYRAYRLPWNPSAHSRSHGR